MLEPIRTRKRTYDVSGARYFVTCVTRHRRAIFAYPQNIVLLRDTLHRVQELYPFTMVGYAFLPDHFHMLIVLGQRTHIPDLMRSLKRNYTVNHKKLHEITGRVRLWQRSYWEHVIWDLSDSSECLRYIHDNPRHHGIVEDSVDYPDTSLHAYLARYDRWRREGAGVYQYEGPSTWERYEPGADGTPKRPMGE